jgi:tRNA 2-thiouridine synthesizing protein E
METLVIAGVSVEVNEEGFMLNPQDWTKDIAVEIAQLEGIPELTPAHWQVIEFCRQSAKDTGKAPTLRQITNGAGVSTKDLFALFPKGPAKKVAKISGLGKPEGCV